MKRSPLARRTPLRGKPKEKVSNAELAEMAAFKQSIAGKACVVCGATEREALERTRDELGYALGHEAHHAVKQQTLRKLGLPVWDVRLAIPLCAEPCHRRVTSRKRALRREEVPAETLAFVQEFGLELVLERELAA